MYNIKCKLAYDGTAYLGWQKTKMGKSVEEILEKAVLQILQEDVDLQAASRTDAGVHARGQIVNFFTKKQVDLYKLQKGLNAVLPKDISIVELEFAPLEFHPTLNAHGKQYHYEICNSQVQLPFHQKFSWHYPYSLCLASMQEASLALLGTHDFAGFCNERSLFFRDTHCRIEAVEILSLPDDRIRIAIEGNRFLYKMVRNIVGTLVYIGCKKLGKSSISEILKSQDRKSAGVTAPANGLTLKEVFYRPFEQIAPNHQEYYLKS